MEMISLMRHDAIEAGANESSGFHCPDAALYKLEVGIFDQRMRAIARLRSSGHVDLNNSAGAHADGQTAINAEARFDDPAQ
jgi:hypothetical protein